MSPFAPFVTVPAGTKLMCFAPACTRSFFLCLLSYLSEYLVMSPAISHLVKCYLTRGPDVVEDSSSST
ncbi:hypothetical protein DPMN_015842 [Dreissena polymorpha]|uniref:Uncharacterized protein n=1 Tax=Dreissena polymorpha TaxID=45954 RepID=A0A9D4S5V0_DREPO|nr:hypothetical protein DPMN_015842 [Dreissena polymorpha]